MTKSTLFDRLNQELEAFGKKAQAALDEGKLQIELLRLRRRQDRAARDLGMLVHRRERGGETEARRFDSLLLRLDDLQAEVKRLEAQIAQARRGPPKGPQTHPVAAEIGTERAETTQ
jgi:50S ribosomal subunit-associated GTPase HflX